MKQAIIKNNKKYEKQDYRREEELTKLFEEKYREIISERSIFIRKEKQFKSKRFKNFKHSIGDGFLLVWDNPTTPTLYIVEIELKKHDINRHILPQLGDFISFIQSSSIEELNEVRNYIYNEIKKNRDIFEKIQRDTRREVYEIIDNAMEDFQILLVIDNISPELSIGLSQIEKAINVKIRKIEISLFKNKKNEQIILFTDSEVDEFRSEDSNGVGDEYTLNYHLEGKPEKIVNIVRQFLDYIKNKNLKIAYKKYYIGIYYKKKRIFACKTRKSAVFFYSKAKIRTLPIPRELPSRDVSKWWPSLPTEIIVKEPEQLPPLLEYFEELYNLFIIKTKNSQLIA